MKVSDIILFAFLAVSCAGVGNVPSSDAYVRCYEPDMTSLVRNPLSGWTIYEDANGVISDAASYWSRQDMVARRFSSIFYFRTRWSALEPQEGQYAWEHDENIKALIQGALDRGLKLAFCVYVDGQDNICNATPDFVREAGAEGYQVHRLWDPADTYDNWTPYADDPVFQEKFSNFIAAFAKEFDDPDRVDYVDAFNLGWWGEGHHIQYKDPANKGTVFQWIVDLYGSNFKNVMLITNFGTEMGIELEKRFAIDGQGYAIRRNSLASTWFRDTEINTVCSLFPDVPFVAESCYWGSFDDNYQPWTEDPLYGNVFKSWVDVYKQVYDDALRSHANTLDLRGVTEARGWTGRALELVKGFISYGGYRLTPILVEYDETLYRGEALRIRHVWKNSGVGVCPNNNIRWNYKYKVAFAMVSGEDILLKYVDEVTDPSDWIYGADTEYISEFSVELPSGDYALWVCVADTSKEDNPPGLRLAVKGGKFTDGWLNVGNINIR